MSDSSAKSEFLGWLLLIGVPAGVLVLIIAGWMYFGPQYNIYSKKMEGEANLAKIQYERQSRVAEAQAKLDAAKLEAQSIQIKAEADARAIETLGSQLSANPSYLQYQYIQNLAEQSGNQNDRTIVYVPTQNGVPVLPITEAGRVGMQPQKAPQILNRD